MPRSIHALAVLATCGGLMISQSERPHAQAAPQAGPPTLPLVAVVGCLSDGSSGGWVLASGTDPVVSAEAFASTAELAANKPLGKQRYRLLGAGPFGPEMRKGHKVLVKGILIKAQNDNRINVTSLQTVASTCPAK